MSRAIRNTKYFIKYYYRQIIICLILAAGLFMSRSYALTDEQIEDSGWIKPLYTWVDDIVGTEAAEQAVDSVTVAFDENGVTLGDVTIDGVGSVISKINDVSLALAVIFLGMTFLISLLNMREQDIVEEEVFKRLVFLGIGIVLCVYAKTICMGIANIGSGVAQILANISPASNGNTLGDEIKDYIYEQTHVTSTGSGWWDKLQNGVGNIGRGIGFYLQLFIPWLIMKVVGIIISVICWARAIEILILAAFSPLAFADIIEPNNLSSSPGVRFVKSFFVLSLAGAFIVTVIIMCQSISASLLAAQIPDVYNDEAVTFAAATWKLVTVGLAEVGLVMRANQLAKTVLGLN